MNPTRRTSSPRSTPLIAVGLLALHSLASCSSDGARTVNAGPGVAGSSGSGASGAGGRAGSTDGGRASGTGGDGRAGSTDGGRASGTGGGGGSVCSSNQIVYMAPGCGTAAVPVCSDGSGGACASTVCGCDGHVRSDGCYSSKAPFAHFQNGGRSGDSCDPGGMGGQAGEGGSGGG